MATSPVAANASDYASGLLLPTAQHGNTDVKPDEKTPRYVGEDGRSNLIPIAESQTSSEELLMTPRLKKVPWKGKNIMVLLPRDDQRGLPGKSPLPLRSGEVERMFASWKQLGYSVDGFDLLVKGYQPPGTDDSQSRRDWPSDADVARERAERRYQVTLPDLNAWRQYVSELQEAKLRALGVSLAEEDPAPLSVSPPTANPSRQSSAQHSSMPFSPPLPTSSASSSHGIAGYPYPGQFVPSAQSPGLPSGPSPLPFGAMSNKFNSRQSISLPAGSSPFQLRQPSPQGWHPGHAGSMQGLMRHGSPSLANLNSILSPGSTYGIDGLQQIGSPAFNLHQRHQSMQYLPQHMNARASPRLQEVIEEEGTISKSPSMTPEPTRQNPDSLQAEIDDAEYHLEEQLREQLEHEDYNPQTMTEAHAAGTKPSLLDQDTSRTNNLVAQRCANEPSKPPILHHPRSHSRGQSLSHSFFRDHVEDEKSSEGGPGRPMLDVLNEMPEAHKPQGLQEASAGLGDHGTPRKGFNNSTTSGQHEKNLSSTSNPWHDSTSAGGSTRRSSHVSRPSLSTLNVEAPEFKFNPGSNLTPNLFDFSGNTFQPTVFQAGDAAETPSAKSVSQFSGSAKFHATAPSFSPGQSDFSFSSFGPVFRPSVPAFTPFYPAPGSVTSRGGSSSDHAGNRNSIFGNIDILASDIVMPAKKSKAIPIVRPSSTSSVKSTQATTTEEATHEPSEDRPANDSRAKRAWSAAPDGDEVPQFAKRPEDAGVETAPNVARDEHSAGEDGSTLEEENLLLADTSMSSIVTSDHNETKATTAASSQISPIGDKVLKDWAPFDFGGKFEAPNFGESHISDGESDKDDIPQTRSDIIAPLVGDMRQGPESALNLCKSTQPAVASSTSSVSGSQSFRPKLTPKGLGTSRFASPPPQPVLIESPSTSRAVAGVSPTRAINSQPAGLTTQNVMQSVEQDVAHVVKQDVKQVNDSSVDREPTFEEIDAVMQHLVNNPSMVVNKSIDATKWQPPTAVMTADDSPGTALQPPSDTLTRDGTSLTPRQSHAVSHAPGVSVTELEDPFVDPSANSHSPDPNNEFDDAELESEQVSDWEAAFSEEEHGKLQGRARFFDGRVNDVVDGLLASRLEPVEKALFSIQHALTHKSRRTPSSRRDMRSVSLEFQESDADDEDEEFLPQRSMSPRRDRRMEHIRIAVAEAFAVQQRNQPLASTVGEGLSQGRDANVLEALEEIKKWLTVPTGPHMTEPASTADGQVDHQRAAPATDEQVLLKMQELQTKLVQFEDRIYQKQFNVEKAVAERREAQDEAAELHRKLQAAETRVEVEIINRSVFDQRVGDLEERLRQQEDKNEEEIKARRAAEDRLSEVQRLLRISSEEETRLREVLDDRDEKIKSFEQASAQAATRMALLETAQTNSTQSQSEMTNKINVLEADLRDVRRDNTHWRSEAERASEAAGHKAGELAHVLQESRHMQKSLTALASQLEENERLRESWRGKFMTLQDDMSRAARDIAEENARRIKKDQTMLARQEVLDARLQAEAKTHERLEVEMERLQLNERSGMRAVNECTRLEGLLAELQTDNYKLQQSAARYQREFEEARESGASEVRRTRMALQTEIDAANNQVNMIREELEEQNSKLRSELDNVKLDADTSRARNEILLEESQSLKAMEIDDIKRKHQNELDDVQTRFEREISNASEDAQKAEQQLLERLSLSSSKIEHLQDRILHLEDKLEIAKEAAAAAAQAAKSAGAETAATIDAKTGAPQATTRQLDMPEKVSPQALRESIMVLQEQLQAREQRIEELEQVAAKADPDAASKISKRDDEISWLRELLAVRHGDLQDIIAALSGARYDREAVKDAAIRLKANLQMEEQERERAMNGGSAITLPNIAQSIQAATPRVAQTIGPIAAAWGNWRKSNQQPLRSISGMVNGPAVHNATPSRGRGRPGSQGNPLGGLLTPPTSGLRLPPLTDAGCQPTAFASTGRRYTAQSAVPSRSRGESNSSRRSERIINVQETPHRLPEHGELMTPPMMHDISYDSDAQPGDFDDQDFFQDEE